jgi:hypothetical protein
VKYFFYHKLQLSPFASQKHIYMSMRLTQSMIEMHLTQAPSSDRYVTTVKMAHSKMTFFSNQTVKMNPVLFHLYIT